MEVLVDDIQIDGMSTISGGRELSLSLSDRPFCVPKWRSSTASNGRIPALRSWTMINCSIYEAPRAYDGGRPETIGSDEPPEA